jgi:hypothetical protein
VSDSLSAHITSTLTSTLSIYYQHKPERVSTCPVTIHALLHIADSIEASGPVWAAWAFPMERYCGSLTPAVKSRCFPFSSIDRHVTELAQLSQIKLFHGLSDTLSLRAPKGIVAGQFSDPACKYSYSSIFDICISTHAIYRSDLRATSTMFS